MVVPWSLSLQSEGTSSTWFHSPAVQNFTRSRDFAGHEPQVVCGGKIIVLASTKGCGMQIEKNRKISSQFVKKAEIIIVQKFLCQKWDSNPRPHSRTRTPT